VAILFILFDLEGSRPVSVAVREGNRPDRLLANDCCPFDSLVGFEYELEKKGATRLGMMEPQTTRGARQAESPGGMRVGLGRPGARSASTLKVFQMGI